MKKNYLIVGAVAIVIIIGLVVYFSGKDTYTSDDTKVTVDRDSETVTVNTNAGSLTAGEEVTLPDDFPTDVFVIGGTLKSALQLDQGNSFSVSLETSKSVTSVRDEYASQMEDDGWTIQSTLDLAGGSTILAQKDNRTLTVSISTDESSGKTLVVLTTQTNEE